MLLGLGACRLTDDSPGDDTSWRFRDDVGADTTPRPSPDAGVDTAPDVAPDVEPDSNQVDVGPSDADGDGVADPRDNCPTVANGGQQDIDGDGLGDLCDSDQDGDQLDDGWENCPRVPNPEQIDLDRDGQGDECDEDDDGDGVDDETDNCPRLINSGQADRDADGLGNACDDFYRVGGADTVFEPGAGSVWYASFSNFAGDVNGDGFDDMIVTLSGGSGGANGGSNGKNYLFFGEPNRSPVLTPAAADVEIVRSPDTTSYSDMAIGVGDVNADGFDDILVGEQGRTTGADVGDAFLIYGSSSMAGRIELSTADAIFDGEQDEDYAGGLIAPAGDVNGDGYADLLIGAPMYVHQTERSGLYASAIYVVFGAANFGGRHFLANADIIIRNTQISEYGMSTVAGVGDVDGDGLDDIAVGIPFSGTTDRPGDVHVFLGAHLQPGIYEPTDATIHLQGQYPNEQAGFAIAGEGDFNRDGYDDILIGAPKSGDIVAQPGRVYLVRGRPNFPMQLALANQPAWVGTHPGADLGKEVGFVGDINRDGFDEILLGEPDVNVEPDVTVGAARLFYGTHPHGTEKSASQADVSFVGHYRLGSVGYRFDGDGDFDGDGVSDLVLIGRPPNPPNSTVNAAFLFYGPLQ